MQQADSLPCTKPRNPLLTVDVALYNERGEVLLIKRKNPPPGWALPGGFIDYGETVEEAARREVKEETNLDIALSDIAQNLLGVYSAPDRDPRGHTISVVFMVKVSPQAIPKGGDDAAEARFFPLTDLPDQIAFDHRKILADFTKVVGL